MEKDRVYLKNRAIAGFVALSVKRVLIQAVFTVSNIFLARLLFPADFGTFAILSFINNLFLVFADIGLGPSLVQKKDEVTNADLQSVFTFQLILSFSVISVIFVLAPWIAEFYNLGERGVMLFRLNSLVFLFGPFKSTCTALLERNLKFSKLVFIEFLQISMGTILTLILAIYGFGVLSLVFGVLFGNVVATLLYFGIVPWRLRLAIDLLKLKNLAKFGLPLQSGALFGLFSGTLVYLYLGKAVGAANLGYFQFALSLSVLPFAIPDMLNRIIFPLGSRVQQNEQVFRRMVERSVVITSLTTLPISALMIALAPAIITFIYSDKWLPALPALYIGVLAVTLSSYNGVLNQFLLARGQSKVNRNIGLVTAVASWILAPILIAKFNFVGMSLVGIILSTQVIWVFIKLRKITEFIFWKNVLPYLVYAATGGLAAFALKSLLPSLLVSFLVSVSIGAFVYLGLVYLFSRAEITEYFQFLKPYFGRVMSLRISR